MGQLEPALIDTAATSDTVTTSHTVTTSDTVTVSPPPPGEAASPAWWRQGYGRFLTAQGLSSVGDRVSYLVIPFCLLGVGVSPAGVAAVLGARAVGDAMTVLYGGVLGDRLSRRKLMVTADLTRLLTQTAAVLLVLGHRQGIASFMALQFVYGMAEALFKPAAAGMVPDLVPKSQLERANGLLGSVASTGMVTGPLIGGLLVATGLPAVGLAIDAASFLASALLLLGLPDGKVSSRPRRIIADLREGWRTVLDRKWLLILLTAASIFHLISLSAVFSLGPALASAALGGAAVWGVLVTSFGLGGIAGGFIATRFAPARPALVCAMLLAVLSAQPLFLASGAPIPVIAVLQFAAGMSLTIWAGVMASTCQRFVPRDALSRVASFDEIASTSLLPLGYIMVGVLSSQIGLVTAMRTAALVAFAICLSALFSSSIRNLRRGNEVKDET
ncbi:MAG TPA: MFS transporter [Streptosporangiaceae bacterium]|nr:MFS transporter [Streptosporangiaceae bacterium]